MPKRRDIGNEETEELLKRLEKRVTDEYSQAAKEVDAKFKDYMRRFAIKDEIKRKAVEAGVLEKKDYIAWRQSQVMVGERWQAMVNDLSHDLHNANEIALSTAQPYREEAYAINHNWATYEIESQSKINTSYTLYDRQTVERLMRDDPNLLPPPKPGGKTARKLAENKDLIWNRQKVTSAISQGILQGESVPQMTKRLESVAAMDHRAAIRNVRTMVTGAQNAGRVDAAKRARDMGIGLTQVWMATLDMRTRHEHRVLDGQRREIDEPFEVEGEKIQYPGDPTAPAHLVYNCRCTLVQQVKGFEYDIRGDKDVDYSGIEGMTYDEWKEDRREKPNPITLPEEKAEAIKQSYIAAYKQLAHRSNNETIVDIFKLTGEFKQKDGSFNIDDAIEYYRKNVLTVMPKGYKILYEEMLNDTDFIERNAGAPFGSVWGKKKIYYNPLHEAFYVYDVGVSFTHELSHIADAAKFHSYESESFIEAIRGMKAKIKREPNVFKKYCDENDTNYFLSDIISAGCDNAIDLPCGHEWKSDDQRTKEVFADMLSMSSLNDTGMSFISEHFPELHNAFMEIITLR